MKPIGNAEQLPTRKTFIKEGIGTISAITVGGNHGFLGETLSIFWDTVLFPDSNMSKKRKYSVGRKPEYML